VYTPHFATHCATAGLPTLRWPPMFTYAHASADADFDAGFANDVTPPVVRQWERFFRERSAEVLAATPPQVIAYGDHARQKLDLFIAPDAAPDAPTLIAIHGGVWFMFDRWLMHFLVPSFLAAGVHVACPGYRLAPGHGLDAIVADCRGGIAHLAVNADRWGLDPGAMSVLGHSAAGQLAAVMAATSWEQVDPRLPHRLLRAWVGVSGFFDIEPFQRTSLHRMVRFDPEAYRRWNPPRLVEPGQPPALLMIGGRESALLHEMAVQFDALLRAAGIDAEYLDAWDESHFSVLARIGDFGSELHNAVLERIRE
jgi:arylformamidase